MVLKPKKTNTQKDPEPRSMKEASGPLDPFAALRDKYTDSTDEMIQVCGWISRAWRESDAIEITGIDQNKWLAWKIENPDKIKTSITLGQALIFAEIRGVALGITSRRGQAASQKLLMELLGAKDSPGKSLADEAAGNLSPEKQAKARGVFDEDKLKLMAGFEDDNTGDSA
jgi:hypothetical protein